MQYKILILNFVWSKDVVYTSVIGKNPYIQKYFFSLMISDKKYDMQRNYFNIILKYNYCYHIGGKVLKIGVN